MFFINYFPTLNSFLTIVVYFLLCICKKRTWLQCFPNWFVLYSYSFGTARIYYIEYKELKRKVQFELRHPKFLVAFPWYSLSLELLSNFCLAFNSVVVYTIFVYCHLWVSPFLFWIFPYFNLSDSYFNNALKFNRNWKTSEITFSSTEFLETRIFVWWKNCKYLGLFAW